MLEFEHVDNVTLRELCIVITNAAQEPIACSPNNDPREKTLKRKKTRKYLFSTDPKNWAKAKAKTTVLAQNFYQNKMHCDPIKAPKDAEIIHPGWTC